jgi:hypothetical protein
VFHRQTPILERLERYEGKLTPATFIRLDFSPQQRAAAQKLSQTTTNGDAPAVLIATMIRSNSFPLMLGAVLVGKLTVSAIDVTVATAKPSYYPGERLEVLISVTSTGTLYFSSTLQTLYTIDGVYTTSLNGLGILTEATTPHTWRMSHDWSDYDLSLGRHSVVGTVFGYGTSPPANFDIVQPPTPQGNFLVDFETIPATTASVAHLVAYHACGIYSRTSLGAACRLQEGVGGKWVEGFDPYPTGFNVVADFTIPVFGASAKVAGGTGVRMTMTAKNARGQTLANAVSAPITQPGQFAQTLSVKTTEPIASLEWWPSIPNSLTAVDDLFVITTPILSHMLVGNTLRLTWPTVVGANYQLWSSADLITWSPWGSTRAGSGNLLTNDCSLTASTLLFFRVSKSD